MEMMSDKLIACLMMMYIIQHHVCPIPAAPIPTTKKETHQFTFRIYICEQPGCTGRAHTENGQTGRARKKNLEYLSVIREVTQKER